MLRILLVCTGNTCRSPMAERLLRAKIGQAGLEHKIEVLSAGLAAGGSYPASEGAKRAMCRRGCDLENHRSQSLTMQLLDEADLVLTMTARHKQAILAAAPQAAGKVYTLAEYAGVDRDVADPFGGDDDIYDACAAELDELLEEIWPKIIEMAGK